MKKILKYVIFNIICITFILLCTETFFLYKTFCLEVENSKKIHFLRNNEKINLSTKEKIELLKYTFTSKYRKKGELNDNVYRHIEFSEKNENNKSSIILLGCSFAYGYELNKNVDKYTSNCESVFCLKHLNCSSVFLSLQ